MLGEYKRGKAECQDRVSLHNHLPDDCPPVFLVNCKDDPIVDYRNSIKLDEALSAKGISHQYLFFETGGHGFGASETLGSEECRVWKQKFLEWLNKLSL